MVDKTFQHSIHKPCRQSGRCRRPLYRSRRGERLPLPSIMMMILPFLVLSLRMRIKILMQSKHMGVVMTLTPPSATSHIS